MTALIKKEHRWFIRNVKSIPVEFQHALVIAVMDKNKIRNVVRKTREKIDKFAGRCEDQEAISRKSNGIS